MRNTILFLSVVAVLLVWSAPGCVYDPNYEGTHCGPSQSCPDGYDCDPDQKICVKKGDLEPGPEEPQPDGDGGVADDGGLDDGDGGVADDGGPADQGPCGGCLDDQWCDETDNNTCKPCNNPEHCGSDCVACQDGESCNNLDADGFCCQPDECDYSRACNRLDCNGRTYLCKAGFNPLTYSWIPLDEVGAMMCALSDQNGILAELYQCNQQNDEELLFFCPWGGTCQDDGTCQHDLAYAHVHQCGDLWGCDVDHCLIHLKEGESCLFNYDCQSFCCSREQSAVCLPPGDPSQCKITTSLYFRGIDLRSFEASGTDPHDLSNWESSDSGDSPPCDNDYDCDSRDCGDIGKRCWLIGCVKKDSDQNTRDTYFCDDPLHDAKINGSPWPDTPGNCVYE